MLPLPAHRLRRAIAITYVLIVATLAVLVAVPEHPSFAAYAGMMLLAAPLSLLLYLPYYTISLGVLPVDGSSWMWLFHVAWYTGIAVVQVILALKFMERRQRDKAAV